MSDRTPDMTDTQRIAELEALLSRSHSESLALATRVADLEAALGLCLDDLEAFPRSLGMNFTKGAKEARRLLNR